MRAKRKQFLKAQWGDQTAPNWKRFSWSDLRFAAGSLCTKLRLGWITRHGYPLYRRGERRGKFAASLSFAQRWDQVESHDMVILCIGEERRGGNLLQVSLLHKVEIRLNHTTWCSDPLYRRGEKRGKFAESLSFAQSLDQVEWHGMVQWSFV